MRALEHTAQEIASNVQEFAGRAFPAPVSKGGFAFEGTAGAMADPTGMLAEERKAILVAGRSALLKVKKDGEAADLNTTEVAGLEAIVLITGRPALLIQGGKFFPAPANWKALEDHRADIERNLQSVGRINVIGHPSLDWIGTGFLVAEDVLMTNRHVAKQFSWSNGAGWRFEPGMTPSVDYLEELGSMEKAEFQLSEVIGVHDTLDLALLRVSRQGAAPRPLKLAAQFPQAKAGRKVYVVGYPASDSRRNDPDVMRRLFANIYDVKRLQPGELHALPDDQKVFQHDCSTLGGNSGSCVFDLETGLVVGLHFGGRYLETNWAVALWQLTGDDLVKGAGLNYVGGHRG
jgi:S1-C subfamily serine protease